MNMYFRPADGRLMQQSVLKHIKRRPQGVVVGAGTGNDASLVRGASLDFAQASGAAATGWFPENAAVTAEEAAFLTAENQLATVHAEPEYMQVFLTLGKDFPESSLRRLMQRLNIFSADRGCNIIGGNTVYFGDGSDGLIQLLMTGTEVSCDLRTPAPGDRVWFFGEAGCLGAELLAAGNMEMLKKHFSDSYINEMRYKAVHFSVKAAAFRAVDSGAVFLHDISYGGVYTALYQLAEAAGAGINVRHEGIAIKQSVIELCEVLGINPYLLYGTGGLLMVVPAEKEEQFQRSMEETGFRVYPAGEITAEKARVVRAEGFHMERYLNLSDTEAMIL